MKDNDHQKRILDICDLILDADTDQQNELLERCCGDDLSLRADVTKMLERIEKSLPNDPESRDPLQLLGRASSQLGVGDVVGDFTLAQEIGTGGMGVVYRATRSQSGNEQQVAVKVLRAQIVTPELRLRFNIERDVLARLRHPYIAGLVDGGTTKEGTPYIAIELVEGTRIDTFCDQQRMTISDRIALLEKVARALQFAHQNLIIHRDIKPSNILVTPDGIPKLVDFGIAKLLPNPVELNESGLDNAPDDGTNRGATTYFGNQALTPDYASPEQLLEGKVSTSSDIYSLGILATLLLTGRRPYDIDYTSPKAVVAAFDRTETWRASTLVTQQPTLAAHSSAASLQEIARLRATTPAKLQKRFQGDIDTVLAKATHVEPDRRYPSAEAFADDLNNHRSGRPVTARGDSLAYRTWSLYRTNRLTFSVIGATLAALAVGLAAALWQAQIANKRFNDLHEFARVVIGDIYNSVAELPGSTPTRQLIAAEAQHYLDRLAGENLNDSALLSDLSLAYQRIADVQGRPSAPNLGQSELAMENYLKAARVAEQIEDETPDMKRSRAQIYRRRGDLLAWQGATEAAVLELQKSKRMLKRLQEADPDSDRARVDLAYNLVNLGDKHGHPSFENLGNATEAVRFYQEAKDLLTSAAATSSDRELLRSYSVALERLGTMALAANSIGEAYSHFEASRNIRMQLALAHPDHANIQRDSGIASEQIAKVQLRQNDIDGAIENFKRALDVYLRLYAIDPDDVNAKRTVAIGRENLGDALIEQGKPTAALAEFTTAQELLNELVSQDPTTPHHATKLASIRKKIQHSNTEHSQ